MLKYFGVSSVENAFFKRGCFMAENWENKNGIACGGAALHAGPSDTLFEFVWVLPCTRGVGYSFAINRLEGFGSGAGRASRRRACGVWWPMGYDSS